MKKLLSLAITLLTAASSFGDNITDGLTVSGDHFYSYTTVVQVIGFSLAALVGLVGAYSVYMAYIRNDPNIQKKVLTWGCSCLAMVCMTLALPQFFEYQESGMGNNGVTSINSGGHSGSSGNGGYQGGDKYGQIDVTIPNLDDPRWIPDDNYIPITVGGKQTSVATVLNNIYNHVGGGTEGSYGRTIDYITDLYNQGQISQADYDTLMQHSGNLPHS